MAKQNKGVFKKVLRYVKKYSLLIILSIILAAATVAGTLSIPVIIGQSIDFIVSEGNVNFDEIIPLLLLAGGIALGTAVFQWIMSVINNRVTYNVVRDIRNDAIEKIESLPLNYIDTHKSGDIVSRVISDADQFADGLLLGFTQLFTGIVTILGTLSFMLMLEWRITLVVVLLTPLSLLMAKFISKRTYNMFKLRSETLGEQTAFIDETISNQKIVKAFSREGNSADKFDEISERLRKASLKAILFYSLNNP